MTRRLSKRMDINLRALLFGAVVASAAVATIDAVVAAESGLPTRVGLYGLAIVVHLEPATDAVRVEPVVASMHATIR